MRKDAGFDVTDRITVTVKAGEKINDAVNTYQEMIMKGVLATGLELGDAPEGAAVQEWDINDEKAVLSVKKNA